MRRRRLVMCYSRWYWSCQARSLGKASLLVTLPKYGFLLQPHFAAHLKQLQLHCTCNRFGPSLDVELGKYILVVPLDSAQ
jgi:hypothetical protein